MIAIVHDKIIKSEISKLNRLQEGRRRTIPLDGYLCDKNDEGAFKGFVVRHFF
jgi:hypothetical protein